MQKEPLIDKYGRRLNYLRLSVTDRCNFRCYYCMPEEGMDFASRRELLSFDELYLLAGIFCELGITKIRITGGEPFIRKGILPFLERLSGLDGLEQISITSNGTLPPGTLPVLKQAGICKINISLDSLDRERFYEITRRNRFEEVYAGIFKLLEENFEVKLNCVVSGGRNTEDIIPFIELTRHHPLSVRFLEEMPFNGSSSFAASDWDHRQIYRHISRHYPGIQKLEDEKNSTSVNYRIPGYQGSFGIIPSFSRTFCGTCNRVRLAATGEFRTCLYGPPAGNLRELIRSGASSEQIAGAIRQAVSMRKKDGFEAEASLKQDAHESMSVLGG